MYPQYRAAHGQFVPLGSPLRTNSYGCVAWRLTGGYVYRFFANNYGMGLGTPSSGYSTAYIVYAGGSYHFGTWYVR